MIIPTGLPLGRAFHAGEASSTLLRERLGAFQTAFQTDPRPGLVFECERLVFAEPDQQPRSAILKARLAPLMVSAMFNGRSLADSLDAGANPAVASATSATVAR